ncbi:hypothetical protein G6F57_019936 [Rhizopus arrhizus]|nr:hypothetical protein G6F57_019936 [Rhizopus arrhizus]
MGGRVAGGSGGEVLVPLRHALGLGGQHGVDVAFQGDRMDHVALLDRIDDGLAFQDLAEHGVAAVQPIGLDVGDEELAAVGVRAGVGHRQRADLVLHAVLLVFELVARATGATTLRAAALDHEVGDHAVEDQAVIETVRDQVHEVGHGQRRLVGEQLDLDRALGGVESGDEGHEDP